METWWCCLERWGHLEGSHDEVKRGGKVLRERRWDVGEEVVRGGMGRLEETRGMNRYIANASLSLVLERVRNVIESCAD